MNASRFLTCLVSAATACGGSSANPGIDAVRASDGQAADAPAHLTDPRQLATLNEPFGIALDSRNVYVGGVSADMKTADLYAISRADGSAVQLTTGLPLDFSYARVIAVDDSALYFTANYVVPGWIGKVPLTGGSATMLAPSPNGPIGIATDGANVYWADFGVVMSVPVGGGSARTIGDAACQVTDIAIDAANVYVLCAQYTVEKIAMNGAGSAQILATSPGVPNSIAVDATSVYWTSQDGSVDRVALSGGSAVTLNPFQDGEPDNMDGIAIDDQYVYWTQKDGVIERVPLDGESSPIDPAIATGQAAPYAILTDQHGIVWIDNGGPVMTIDL